MKMPEKLSAAPLSYQQVTALNSALAVDTRLPWAANSNDCALRRDCGLGILMHEHGIKPSVLGRVTVVFDDKLKFKNNLHLARELSHVPPPCEWDYHTALTVEANNERNQKTIFVLDPSISPLKPLTLQEFLSTLTAERSASQLTGFFTGKLGEAVRRENVTVFAGNQPNVPLHSASAHAFGQYIFEGAAEYQNMAMTKPGIMMTYGKRYCGTVPLSNDWVSTACNDHSLRYDLASQTQSLGRELQLDPEGKKNPSVQTAENLGLTGQGYVNAYMRHYHPESASPMTPQEAMRTILNSAPRRVRRPDENNGGEETDKKQFREYARRHGDDRKHTGLLTDDLKKGKA